MRGLLLFTPVYLLASQAGQRLQFPEIGAAVLFAPYAVLAAALIAAPRRHWVWYILVAVVTHTATHWTQWSWSGVLFANSARIASALTAALLLRRLLDVPPRLNSLGALLRFIASAVLVAPAVGATLAAANVIFHGAATSYWRPWLSWFMSSALTGLTLLPALVAAAGVLTARRPPREHPPRVVEGTLLGVALAATCAVAFLLPALGKWHSVLPLYAPLPVLIWAAWRFGWGVASAVLSATAIAAVIGTDHGTGPFFGLREEDIFGLQLFVALTSLPVLCVAAVVSARQDAVHLYRALLTSLADHVAILDNRGVVLEVNDSWRRFAERPDGGPFHHVLEGDDYEHTCRASAAAGSGAAARTLEGLTTVLARGARRFELEYDWDHQGRRERYAVHVEALERADGGAVVTRTNMTTRQEAQLALEKHRLEVSHLARVSVLGQLSGALAHELNQPLSSISNNAEAALLLLNRQPRDLEEIRAILRDIVDDDQRAAQVIRRLSALIKRGETNLAPLDLNELITDVLELARGELIARRVVVQSDLAPHLPQVMGDRVQLVQVMLNIILNACEGMSGVAPGDRRLVIEVSGRETGHLHVAFRDRGTGISPELIDRLFEPFVTTKPQGLGLGLSIARTIVAAHGGRLWAENNPGGGATIHCLLPLAPRA